MKQKIRHLEFYGYPDQNVYMGLPMVDLSDIRETNREQDKEIDALSGATKEKVDINTFNQLSGKVDTFIERQNCINERLDNGIRLNRERIERLEIRDEEITNKINEIVDDFNPIYDDIRILSSKTETIETKLDEHIAESVIISGKVESLEEEIDKKVDKEYAENTFAKKDDVYTKEEVDGLISDFTTEEWVLNQGYITESTADERYATKTSLNELDNKIDNVQTTLSDQYNELNSNLLQFEADTDSKINSLSGSIDTLNEKHERDILNLTNKTDGIQNQVNQNTEAIDQINDVLPNKVDKTEFDELKDRVNDVENSLDDKVDKDDYERDKIRFGNQLDALDNRKANKTDLIAVSGAVDNLDNKIEQEAQNRINADSALGNRIDAVNNSILDIREENVERDSKISAIESGLTKEINDRIEGDNAIIGTPDDRDENNTIYGAKKYADKVANEALNDAKDYAEIKDSAIIDYVDETKADLQRQITAKADKDYVDAVQEEIEATIDSKVNDEKTRAQEVENGIINAISQETARAIRSENGIISALTHVSNIVKALTDWDGDDRETYSDNGNGIIDVMHREIHEINANIRNIYEILERIIPTSGI